MRRYKIELLYPWDDRWYTLEHLGPFWTVSGARKALPMQSYARGVRFRVTKSGVPVWSE